MLSVFPVPVVVAQDQSGTESSQPGVTSGPADLATTPAQEPADRRSERRRAVTAGMLLLAGIVVVGVTLVGLTMVWGHRLRRIGRAEQPTTTTVDPLWYLKNDVPQPGPPPPTDKEFPAETDETEP